MTLTSTDGILVSTDSRDRILGSRDGTLASRQGTLLPGFQASRARERSHVLPWLPGKGPWLRERNGRDGGKEETGAKIVLKTKTSDVNMVRK